MFLKANMENLVRIILRSARIVLGLLGVILTNVSFSGACLYYYESFGNKMIKKSLIVSVFIFICCSIGVAEVHQMIKIPANHKYSKEELVLMLKSGSANERSAAMLYIIKVLEKNEIVIDGELKKTCHEIVVEKFENRLLIDTPGDDEGIYGTDVCNLAAAINEKSFLPFFIEMAPHYSEVIVKNGDDGINALIEYSNKKNLSPIQKMSLGQTFFKIIEMQKTGAPLSYNSRQKIKQRAIEMLGEQLLKRENSEKANPVEEQHLSNQAATKQWMLKTFAIMGDKDLSRPLKKSLQTIHMCVECRKKILRF